MGRKAFTKNIPIKKADIILMAVCIFLAILLGIFLTLGTGTGNTVTVSYDGEVIAATALNSQRELYCLITYSEAGAVREYMEQCPAIPENGSYNILHITDGVVTMEASDCKDQICVGHKPIAKNRENIICLPHKLVVEIAGDSSVAAKEHGTEESDENETPELDGMVR